MPESTSNLTLGQKQRLFTRLLAQLITHAYDKGYELTLADGNVDPVRRGRPLDHQDAPAVRFVDTVHMPGSLHYCRLAQDLNLFVGGGYIDDGGHPAWADLGVWWEAQHPLCAWGGRFQDANHFSVQHEGKK